MINDKKKFADIEWIIFDADGVITSESDYWLAGELVILEVLFGDQFVGIRNEPLRTIMHKPGAAVVPDRFLTHDFIAAIKNSGIGNNWDATFISLSLYIIELLSQPESKGAHGRFIEDGVTPNALHDLGRALGGSVRDVPDIDLIAKPFFEFAENFTTDDKNAEEAAANGDKAAKLIHALSSWLAKKTEIDLPLFSSKNNFWIFCRDLFQNIFLGDHLSDAEGFPKVSRLVKDGLLQYESPLMPLPQIIDTLTLLNEARIKLGIGTGRPYIEIMAPLSRWGVVHLFEAHNVATHREIHQAQSHFETVGKQISLSKPHPFVFLRAMFPEKSDEELLSMKLPIKNAHKYLIVGDAPVDMIAAKRIGCRTAANLSTARMIESLEMAAALARYNPDFVLRDITELKELF